MLCEETSFLAALYFQLAKISKELKHKQKILRKEYKKIHTNSHTAELTQLIDEFNSLNQELHYIQIISKIWKTI